MMFKNAPSSRLNRMPMKVEKIKPISFTRLIRTNPIVLAYWTANPAGAQR